MSIDYVRNAYGVLEMRWILIALVLTGCATRNYENLGEGRFLQFAADGTTVTEQYEFTDPPQCRDGLRKFHTMHGNYDIDQHFYQCRRYRATLDYMTVFEGRTYGKPTKYSASDLDHCKAITDSIIKHLDMKASTYCEAR